MYSHFSSIFFLTDVVSASHLFYLNQYVQQFVIIYVQNLNMYSLRESHTLIKIYFHIISIDSVSLWNHIFYLEKIRNISIMIYYISNNNQENFTKVLVELDSFKIQVTSKMESLSYDIKLDRPMSYYRLSNACQTHLLIASRVNS